MEKLTHEQLIESLNYDADTGVFMWLTGVDGTTWHGRPAGCKTKLGYIRIRVRGELVMAHRLAWLYVNKRWPEDQLDHINGVRDDNRIVNLREVNSAENSFFGSQRATTTSQFVGVHWDRRRQCWQSFIGVNGKKIWIGGFNSETDAAIAWNAYVIKNGLRRPLNEMST